MTGPVLHFRNFLSVTGSALCDVDRLSERDVTLNPDNVTCERCLERLGRLRQAHIAPPTPPDHPKRGK